MPCGLSNSLNLLGSQFPYLFRQLGIQRLPVFLIGPHDVLEVFLNQEHTQLFALVCMEYISAIVDVMQVCIKLRQKEMDNHKAVPINTTKKQPSSKSDTTCPGVNGLNLTDSWFHLALQCLWAYDGKQCQK